MTILIVDDNEKNLYLLQSLLAGSGYQVDSAANGAEALAKARQKPPDLIVSDILMPGMDGFALCRKWKQDERLRSIPFVFYIATYTDERDRELALSLGAARFLVKPEEPEVFVRTIREVIRQVLTPSDASAHRPIEALQEEEAVYLKEHDKALIRKLEAKMHQLEQTNRELERDITERKRAETEREKLEAQNRQLQKSESLSRMAGAIAHHFNNQLHVVMMNLELLKTAQPLTAGSVEFLTEAMRAVRKAAEMSNLMLTYVGKTVGKREPLDLAKTCLRHLSLLRAVLPPNVVLETDLPDPGPAISGSANQILQVLTNLVNNAWEASGNGRGAIRLSVRTVAAADIPAAHRFPIDWQPQDPAYACLEVDDTGGGIPNQNIEKIFDPFFSTKFIGRGLGLAVILGIVRAHHGVITVASKPGQGSVFRVFFPVLDEAAPRKPTSVAPAPEFKGDGTLLLVEDDPNLRRVVMLALTKLGFTVIKAKDGLEAVELFRQHQAEIHLVLCDLTMPRMNGWETLTALHKMAPGLPVILSSDYNEAQAMVGSHTELPQAFLSKPYAPAALIHALRQALGKQTK